MDGIRIHDVALYLMELPNRKGLAFAFMDGNILYPVAYVSQKHDAAAREYWGKFLKGSVARVEEGI